jgi:hypothetical protein
MVNLLRRDGIQHFHDGGLLFAHVNLPLPTVSSHLSFHSLRFSSLVVQSAYALVDIWFGACHFR